MVYKKIFYINPFVLKLIVEVLYRGQCPIVASLYYHVTVATLKRNSNVFMFNLISEFRVSVRLNGNRYEWVNWLWVAMSIFWPLLIVYSLMQIIDMKFIIMSVSFEFLMHYWVETYKSKSSVCCELNDYLVAVKEYFCNWA